MKVRSEHRMSSALAFASLLMALSLMGCGGASEQATASKTPGQAAPAATTPAASPTAQAPTYAILAKGALEKTLVGVDELPPGYSQDPPKADSGNKTFCDYKVPAEEKVRVGRDFTKGGGLSAELMSITLRQFASEKDAKAAWSALTETLKTCKSEVYQGTTLTYSPMSAPKIGDASVGVKLDADGTTLVQNFVLVGPTMISGGGGGLMNADVDTVAKVLEAQVEQYLSAAKK